MPRLISAALLAALDGPRSAAALLYFVTLTHANLDQPIRVVANEFGDNVGPHILAGTRYENVPFQLKIMQDDGTPPRGQLSILNVDPAIGRAVRAMGSRPSLAIAQYAAADFSADLDPTTGCHIPIGTPSLEFEAPYLTLVNIKVDALWVSGDIASYLADISQEPASPLRLTQDIFPGPFR